MEKLFPASHSRRILPGMGSEQRSCATYADDGSITARLPFSLQWTHPPCSCLYVFAEPLLFSAQIETFVFVWCQLSAAAFQINIQNKMHGMHENITEILMHVSSQSLIQYVQIKAQQFQLIVQDQVSSAINKTKVQHFVFLLFQRSLGKWTDPKLVLDTGANDFWLPKEKLAVLCFVVLGSVFFVSSWRPRAF